MRLRLTLSKKALRSVRRALRRGVKLTATVTVIATDAAGNSAQGHPQDQAEALMSEAPMTEQQLATYEPRTTSGAALKERLEAAAGCDEGTADSRRLLR